MADDNTYMANKDFPTPIYTQKDDPASYRNISNEQGYENERYQYLLGDFLKCTTFYLNEFESAQRLEKQLSRLDLDTVCAYEIY